MILRPQIAAIAVLLVALGLVFVTVGDAGVHTQVKPAGSAENWAPGQEQGQLVHTSGLAARIIPQVQSWDLYIQSGQYTPPAEDSPEPLVDVLSQTRTMLDTLIQTNLLIDLPPEAFTGPAMIQADGVPVALLRLLIEPQAMATGETYPGLDYAIALIDMGNGDVHSIEYVLQGTIDPSVYADFRAWLEANATELATPEIPGALKWGVPPVEGASPDQTTALPPASEQRTMLVYTADPDVPASITYYLTTMDGYAQPQGIQAPSADAEFPLLDLLTQVRAKLAADDTQQATFTGPALQRYSGVTVATLRAEIPNMGTEIAGQDVAYVLIDRGDGDIVAIQYYLDGEPDPTIFADFEAWLSANAVDLGTPPPEEEREAPETLAPLPLPSDNWERIPSGQFTYIADPDIQADVTYNVISRDLLLMQIGLSADSEEEVSLTDVLDAIRTSFQAQGGLDPSAFQGPDMLTFDGVEVGILRTEIPGQVGADGQPSPGQDFVIAMIEAGEDQVTQIQYVLYGYDDSDVYDSFLAWLEVNAASLAQPTATAESTADWIFAGPVQFAYPAGEETEAQISYEIISQDDFVQRSGLQSPTGDDVALDLLGQIRTMYETQLEQMQVEMADDAVQGPEMRTFGGVDMGFLSLQIEAQTLGESDQESPGTFLVHILIIRPSSMIIDIQYSAQFEDEPDAAAYAEFEAWLEANAAALAGQAEPSDDTEAAEGTEDSEETQESPDTQTPSESPDTEEAQERPIG